MSNGLFFCSLVSAGMRIVSWYGSGLESESDSNASLGSGAFVFAVSICGSESDFFSSAGIIERVGSASYITLGVGLELALGSVLAPDSGFESET
ncbi:MAG: hypothetical protein O7D36_09155, partial [Gammaproteobacteria bacterium]|nr:hypothetical protein [Gammaproteobacteria bacterium]